MTYPETYIAHLLLKQASGELTPEDALALQEWRAQSVENEQLYDELLHPRGWPSRLREFQEAAAQAALVQAPAVDPPRVPEGGRLLSLRSRSWLRYAAIFFILLGGGALWWMSTRTTAPSITVVKPGPAEIAAAGYKATLTLADGSIISLDSSSAGAIAQQGGTAVVKTPGGEIRYERKGIAEGHVMMNTMRTPRGGQYRLVLPDGTKVWLNAASSVTYPAAFTGHDRTVRMTGEAYFEVAADRSKPFFVDINGEGTVQVLGTEFNVNAYKDHGAIVTTLVTGALRAISGAPGRQKKADSVTLSPGQQAVQQTGAGDNGYSVAMLEDVNLAQVLAWKNGIFDFTGASFKTLLKEVERWYDVDVVYEGAVPDIRFKGKMDRGVKLSGVIRFLSDYGVDAQLNGRTLIIKRK